MEGCSYWTFSDIFEELTFFTRPFSGSFGLQTIHGIPKPSYHAFALLNRLGGERFDLPVTDAPIELAAFKKGNTLQFLLYRQNYCEGSDQAEPVRLLVDTSLKSAAVRKIDREHCNPLQYWRDMGAPETLLPGQAEEITAATVMQEEALAVENTPGGAVMQAALADNDVWLVEAEMHACQGGAFSGGGDQIQQGDPLEYTLSAISQGSPFTSATNSSNACVSMNWAPETTQASEPPRKYPRSRALRSL